MNKQDILGVSVVQNKSIEDRVYAFYKALKKAWKPQDLENKVEVRALLLDRDEETIGVWEPSIERQVNPREVFMAALNVNAASIVLAQSDPTDDVEINSDAVHLLDKFKDAGREFNIKLVDFLILSKWSYNSFLENRRL